MHPLARARGSERAVVIRPIVRVLTISGPSLDFVRTLTTFRPLWGRRPGLPFRHGDLRQFRPLKNTSKTEQNGTKPEQNGHINRKNLSKTSAFCLTYLNIASQKSPSRPRINDWRQKKRAFRGFGEVKIDVSLMECTACDRTARPVRLAALAQGDRWQAACYGKTIHIMTQDRKEKLQSDGPLPAAGRHGAGWAFPLGRRAGFTGGRRCGRNRLSGYDTAGRTRDTVGRTAARSCDWAWRP